MTIMIALLSLILGLLLGFYGRAVYDRLNQLYAEAVERRLAKEVGVVRPVGIPVTKNQPLDRSSDTGPVMRASPAALEEMRQAERAEKLRINHS
jgi:hypothetical protein